MSDSQSPGGRADWRELVEPMRPVDYVQEPERPSRWVYRARGWRGQILPALWMILLLTHTLVWMSGVITWWTWWLGAIVIVVVFAIVNAVLVYFSRRTTTPWVT